MKFWTCVNCTVASLLKPRRQANAEDHAFGHLRRLKHRHAMKQKCSWFVFRTLLRYLIEGLAGTSTKTVDLFKVEPQILRVDERRDPLHRVRKVLNKWLRHSP